jgi:hypothetical protein
MNFFPVQEVEDFPCPPSSPSQSNFWRASSTLADFVSLSAVCPQPTAVYLLRSPQQQTYSCEWKCHYTKSTTFNHDLQAAMLLVKLFLEFLNSTILQLPVEHGERAQSLKPEPWDFNQPCTVWVAVYKLFTFLWLKYFSFIKSGVVVASTFQEDSIYH